MKRVYWAWTGLACCVAVGLLWKTNEVAAGVRRGLECCAGVIIPSLFPFMILAGLIAITPVGTLLSRLLYPVTGRLTGMPRPLGSVLLMSFIGGFPVGAKMLSQMYGQGELSRKDCETALCCCVNSGPSFLISAVGAGMLGSKRAGLFLLAAQVISALVIGAVEFRKDRSGHRRALPEADRTGGGFVAAVQGASSGILGICAFVVAFSALSALLEAVGVMRLLTVLLAALFPVLGERFFAAALTGILEVTNGCMASAALHTHAGFILCAFLVSFSSLSIVFQIRSCFPADTDVRFGRFYRSRLYHGVLSALLAALFCRWLPVEELAAMAGVSRPVPAATPDMAVSAVCLVCMCTILMLPQRARRR